MKFRALIAVAALASVSAPAMAAVNLTGTEVKGTLLYPNSTVYAGPATATVGPQVEFPQGTFSPAPQTFDIGANTISFFTNAAATYSSDADFNGFRIDFTGYNGTLSGVTLLSGSFAPVDFYLQGNSFFLNLDGQTVGANDFLNFQLSGAVPEPATWAMMIGGFGMIGGSVRAARRKQKAVLATA